MKMMKRMTLALAAILMISIPLAAASPKSDGYYGKTKVAAMGQVEAHPFDLGQVELLPSQFEKAMKINQKSADQRRTLWRLGTQGHRRTDHRPLHERPVPDVRQFRR
jgi:hypothetical protein